MGRWGTALLLAGATLLAPGRAEAQLFGQWSWDALVGLESRSYTTEISGNTLTDYTERSFRLGLGLNGYVIHPAIARFRLGLDATLSDYSGTTAPDTDRWGIRGELALLPFSRYPTHFFVVHSRYDYTIGADDPLLTTGLADTTTSWGARIRFRGGFLGGLTAGTERTDTSFVDPATRNEVLSRQYLDWSGASGRLNHHYRLERDYRRYGRTPYTLEDYTLNLDEHGPIAERWRWDLSGVGFHRTTEYRGISNSVDSGRLLNRFVHTTRRNDLLDLSYNGGFSRSDATSGTSHTHTLTARYTWWARKTLQVIPTVGYSLGFSGDLRLTAPTAGVSVSWSHTGTGYDLLLNGGLGGVWTDTTWDGGSTTSNGLSWSAGGTVGTGTEERIRAELDLSLAANELTTAGDLIEELPGGGTEFERVGTQDRALARLTLRKRVSRWRLAGYVEHRTRRQEATLLPTLRVTSDYLSVTADGPRVGFNLNAGLTDGRTGDRNQDVRFYGVSVHWNPIRRLTLRGIFQDNRSRVELGPDVDRRRVEAEARYTWGRFALWARTWNQEETVDLRPRTNRGLIFGISARFGGWLPFVSAPQRRGVIR